MNNLMLFSYIQCHLTLLIHSYLFLLNFFNLLLYLLFKLFILSYLLSKLFLFLFKVIIFLLLLYILIFLKLKVSFKSILSLLLLSLINFSFHTLTTVIKYFPSWKKFCHSHRKKNSFWFFYPSIIQIIVICTIIFFP